MGAVRTCAGALPAAQTRRRPLPRRDHAGQRARRQNSGVAHDL